MKNTEPGWFQVVFDPEDQKLQAMMKAAKDATWDTPMKMTPWLAIRMQVGQWLHPIIHHYVPMKQWDPVSQRVISTPYVTCLWCPLTKEA